MHCVRRWFVASALLLLGVVIPTAVSADPIEKTPYGQACLRIEGRLPEPKVSFEEIDKLEPALAGAGVQARWIQVVDDSGSPLVENPYLPCPYSPEVAAANEKLLEHWVDKIHQSGVAAVSWFSLSYCKQGNRKHPDWRQVSILPWPHPNAKNGPCCVISPYGDALINYCNWVIERFKLDGVWFDGSFWTPLWERPYPLTCRCETCQKRFKGETGLEIPEKPDWADPTFRRWLAWRYQAFGGYIGRMAAAIRQAHPQAIVAINHYHRGDAPWQGGVPMNRYAADIITGSEAYTAKTVDVTMRLCRAYGRSQSEVWRRFDIGSDVDKGVEHLLEHALVCYEAGGQPSYGHDVFGGQDENAAAAMALMTPIMKAIHPYVGGKSLPYCAVHVSQQTETFCFGPSHGGDPRHQDHSYFDALTNWTEGFGRAHLPPDYVYDADFTLDTLSRYPLLLMPLSMALDDAQAQTAVEYVRSGGTLLLGPGAGQCDPQGWPRDENLLAQAFGFAFDKLVPPDAETFDVVSIVDAAGKETTVQASRRGPLRLTASEWRVLGREGKGADAPPAVAMRPFGQGRVMIMSFDGGDVLGSEPTVGGDTGVEVVAEAPASGKYSLKFTDGPNALQPYYPVLETRIVPFEASDNVGGTLQLDLKVDRSAAVIVDIRATAGTLNGPRLTIEPDGKVLLCGQAVGQIPADQWVHTALSYDYARDGKPSTCQVALTLPGGQKLQSPPVATPAADFRRTDRVVIFGPGKAPATFQVDQLELYARKSDGGQGLVCQEDFERGAEAFLSPSHLVLQVARMLSEAVPPPLTVEAPPEVRAGLFEAENGRIYVHLHDWTGKLHDWQQPTGPEVILRGRLSVRAARLAVGDRPLEIRRQGDGWEIPIPAIGLYQVVVLER